MAGSEWCTGGIRINRRVIKDKPNNYMPTTRRPMQRSKQYLLADTLAVARRLPTATTKVKVHANVHARYEQDPPASDAPLEPRDPPWAGSPVPQAIYARAHGQGLIAVPHDDAMPWPLSRGPCETPKMRVPHDEDILAANARLAALVNECETLRRDDAGRRRPNLAPERIPPRHALEDRAKLIEDRCAAFERRWWDDGDAAPAPRRR